MKYNRHELIYKELGSSLREKFLDIYKINPADSHLLEMDHFNACMKEFIEQNKDNLIIKRACETFPALMDIPHPDQIPETWHLTPKGRETMTYGYIEKLETINYLLTQENTELKKKNNELKSAIEEMERTKAASENKPVEPVQSDKISGNSIEADIHQKMFVSPESKYRYAALSSDDICWICDNVTMSDTNLEIFEMCCQCGSLREVSEKMGMSLSAVKRRSAVISDSIRLTLQRVLTEIME